MSLSHLTSPRRLQYLLRMSGVVAAGGAIGGTLRCLFLLLHPTDPGSFPWVIFLENLTGAFLLGFAVVGLARSYPHRRYLRVFLTTGMLGSFTTFSNYTMDIVLLGDEGALGLALLYGLGSLGGGLLAAFLGVLVARMWMNG